ncbi:hypothetical protein ACLZX5_04145 [Enterococcus faecium]
MNGKLITQHKGRFRLVESKINWFVKDRNNRITVAVNNTIDDSKFTCEDYEGNRTGKWGYKKKA